MNSLIDTFTTLYNINSDYKLKPVDPHEGGRNKVYICTRSDKPEFVIRVSMLGDRTEEEYQAETDFIHFLAQNGASVADVIPSVNGKFVEKIAAEGKEAYISCFTYAKGMLLYDNDYRYREGHPLSEYFFNTGKTLGRIHKLSKQYNPVYRRKDYFDKYNMTYIDELIPNDYQQLKTAISKRFERFHTLPVNRDEYGLVHFDFSDGNYHVDMETGDITVFDFDNCMYCWYMFDLAHLWTHGVGWYWHEKDRTKRRIGMQQYFDTILEGYRTETDVSEESLSELPLFIDMVLIENIVDVFECCKNAGTVLDYEDIEDAAECLINDIEYVGFI